MKTGIFKLMAIVVICSVLLSACGGQPSAGSFDKKSDGVKIVTSFYPVYIATINITRGIQGGVMVTNLTEPATGCLHDYNLRTGDMKRLEGADILVINGAGMESFMDGIIKQQPQLKIVDASRGIRLLKDEATGGDNAHVWVSISGEISQVQNIADQLSAYNPEYSEAYKENARTYINRLKELEKRMHVELDNLKEKDIVTFHEAFSYFANEFGLNVAAVMEVEPGVEPEAGKLAALIETVKKGNVKSLFTEPQYSSDIAEVVSKETGAAVYELDPVVTGEADGDTDAYIKRMEENMKTLKEALSN